MRHHRLLLDMAVSDQPFDLVWFWKGTPFRPIYRKGERCRILIRGSKNSVLVEFEDGFKVVCAKWAVRPAPQETQLHF